MDLKKLKKLIKDPLVYIADSPAIEKAIARSIKYKKSKSNILSTLPQRSASRLPQLEPTLQSVRVPKNIQEPQFNSSPLSGLSDLKEGEKSFVYLPWIKLHGDKIINKIKDTVNEGENNPLIVTLDLFTDLEKQKNRKIASKYSRYKIADYRKKLIKILEPHKNKIAGIIVTFDWHPVARTLVRVAKELDIPSIAILHESVFMDEDAYYQDTASGVNHPICDVVYCWGELQKKIFTDRGVDPQKLKTIGAIKFDTHNNFTPELSNKDFRKLFKIADNSKVILFAAQPMDAHSNVRTAREAQDQAIRDVCDYIKDKNLHLLIRTPPSGDQILSPETLKIAKTLPNITINEATKNEVEPEECIFHSDVVTSINSTMLFEAQLMDRPSISAKYVQFEQIWADIGIPSATDKAVLHKELDKALKKKSRNCGAEGYKLAAKLFSNGTFDGQATIRISNELKTILASGIKERSDIVQDVINEKNIKPIVALGILNNRTAATFQKHVPAMLGAKSNVGVHSEHDSYPADVILQWGIKDSQSYKATNERVQELGVPKLILEDGFIRSLNLGIKNEPTLSVIMDKNTSYYDAYNASYLEELLEKNDDLDEEKKTYTRQIIDKIVSNKITKFNHAPISKLNIGSKNTKKVLLIDQRFGDQSVKSGMMEDEDYYKMLDDALVENPKHDIIIKRHPDANSGLKESYYQSKKLEKYKKHKNLYFIDYDINIYSVLDEIEKVYVGTSGAGFEALMAGKEVHCYGVPFYANWGLTIDKKNCGRRTNKVSLEKIFYYAYIVLSRYYHPDLKQKCSINEICDFILENRGGIVPKIEDSPYYPMYKSLSEKEKKDIKGIRLLRLMGDYESSENLINNILSTNPKHRTALEQLYILNEYKALKPRFRNTPRAGFALQKCAGLKNIKTALDIGAGDGDHSYELGKLGLEVTALDLGKSVYFEKKNKNVDFVIANFYDYNPDKQFDLVWASHVLEHQPNPNEFLKKALDLTKPGGWIAVTIPPLKHNIVGGHVTLWNAGLLAYQLILAGFDCSEADIIQYGYNISAVVQKPLKPIELPELSFDSGDVDKLKHFFPKDWDVKEGFDGTLGREFIPVRF